MSKFARDGLLPICIADCRAVLGEGPVWVEREQALYWVDIKSRRLFCFDPAFNTVWEWTPPSPICSLALRRGEGFIAGTERGFAFVDPRAKRFEFLKEVEPQLPGNRFNDGKVDRQGRFWAGTMDDAEQEASGSLYRLDGDLNFSRIDDGYLVTNGPAFSVDGRTLYHTDSARQIVYAFDLDDSGQANCKRIFAQFGNGEGYPDGMTVDAEGFVWIAFWDGWCIRRLSPAGKVVETVELPVQRPTSCAFGGRYLDQLFVTSARVGLSAEELAKQPQAGGLFLLCPGVSGVPDVPFKG